jgi:mRNA interferase HigB
MLNIRSQKKLRGFYSQHPDAKEALNTWYKVASKAEWKDLNDLKLTYPSADYVGDDRVVFNIRGNHYRLIVRINFQYKNAMIKWIGTHAEYDKIDAKKV